jgi:hypothetical protein
MRSSADHNAVCKSRQIQQRFSVALTALVLRLSFAAPSFAIVAGNVPGTVPNTTINPESFPGWDQGDPGWDNVAAAGANFVYLGDGWVLSARHVSYQNGIQLKTYSANGSPGPIKTFAPIPGSHYYDYGYFHGNLRQYAVSNPSSLQSETGSSISLAASNGTNFTDLQLFRISEDPGLPALNLASAPMPSNFVRSNAPEVVYIGNNGFRRQTNVTQWNVSGTAPELVWDDEGVPVTHQGYLSQPTTDIHRFGTNRLADIRPNFNGDPNDNGAINYTQNPNRLYLANELISDTTGARCVSLENWRRCDSRHHLDDNGV